MSKMKLVKSIVITIAALTAACIFASPTAAQTKVKTLFTWTGGGGNPESTLIFDSAGNPYGATSDR
jgi:ABC-type glycerol-3-phosphate transport system substrate-binding protein